MSQPKCASESSQAAWFSTTHWTVVFKARDGDATVVESANEQLCRTYWRPVYAFLRRDGHSIEDAQDLTQEFFARFLEKHWLSHLRHRDGRFRSFLLTLLKHFLSDHRDKVAAKKRGGGMTFVSLAEFAAEDLDNDLPVNGLTADQVFERRWARSLFDQAAARLRMEYVNNSQAELFDVLKDLQPGAHGPISYTDIGARFGMSESAIKSAVHRLRRRHSEILRGEIGRTLNDPAEFAAEVRYLLQVLSRGAV